jgi:hypothetical protein
MERGEKKGKKNLSDVVGKWERKKKIGKVVCRPSWGESECEGKK